MDANRSVTEALAALVTRADDLGVTDSLPASLPVPSPGQLPSLPKTTAGASGPPETTPHTPTPLPSVSPRPQPPALPGFQAPGMSTAGLPSFQAQAVSAPSLPNFLPPVTGSSGLPSSLTVPGVSPFVTPQTTVPHPPSQTLPVTGVPGGQGYAALPPGPAPSPSGMPIPGPLAVPAGLRAVNPTNTPPGASAGPLASFRGPPVPSVSSLLRVPEGNAAGNGQEIASLLREILTTLQALASQAGRTSAGNHPQPTLPALPGSQWAASYVASAQSSFLDKKQRR